MNRQELVDLYLHNFDKETDRTPEEGFEKIKTALFVLACAVTEAANDICAEMKKNREAKYGKDE